MATSESGGRGPASWFGTRAHYLGSAGAAVGVASGLAAGVGAWTALMAAGLYGAGAVLGWSFPGSKGTEGAQGAQGTQVTQTPPVTQSGGTTRLRIPERPLTPVVVQRLRFEVAERTVEPAPADWPAEATEAARRLLLACGSRLAASTAEELAEAVARSLTGTLDWYERALQWQRLGPQGEDPTVEFLSRVDRAVAKLSISAP